MSHEFQGLDVLNVSRTASKIDHWLPNVNHKELDRPVTKIFLGLSPSGESFFPVEIDLLKEAPKTVFIVGNSLSRKEDLLKGFLQFAGEAIAPGCLKINTISHIKNPYKLDESHYVRRHMKAKDSAHAHQGIIATVILNQIDRKLDAKKPVIRLKNSENPHILAIDDLGFLFSNGRPETVDVLKKVLGYQGWQPFMTIALVEDVDIPVLRENGFGPEVKNQAIWLVGQSSSPDAGMSDFPSGYFLQWDPKRKKVGNNPLTAFDCD